MTSQLAFTLPVTEAFRREDFFTSPTNEAALTAVQAGQNLLLVGPYGTGKTHLAHIWTRLHGATALLPTALAQHLPDLAPDARIAVDNAQTADQDLLFHLYNLLIPQGKILLTAPTPPRDWATLPDLRSRLQTLPMARLDPPDDALLAAVLIKLFADRQITVAPNLIPYLTSRMERSIAAARTLVAELDAASLAAARPITRTLAAEVMDTQYPLPFD